MNLQVGAEYRNYNVPSGTSEEESRKEPPQDPESSPLNIIPTHSTVALNLAFQFQSSAYSNGLERKASHK